MLTSIKRFISEKRKASHIWPEPSRDCLVK